MSYYDVAWNPDRFDESYQFFKGKHAAHIQAYIESCFPKNYMKMKKRTTQLTRRNILSSANIYTFGVTRTFDREVEADIQEMVTLAMQEANRFDELNSISALWYSEAGDGKPMLKALPASKFTVELDGDGGIECFYVRVRQLQVKTDTERENWEWYKYSGGQVYSGYGETFDRVSDFQPLNMPYTELPFFLLHNPSDDLEPMESPFVEAEKDLVGGMALSRLGLTIAQLQLIVALGANSSEIEKLRNIIGKMTGFVGLRPEVSDLKAIDMGDTSRNLDFQEFVTKEIEMQAVQFGADWMSISPDKTVQSGKSREVQKIYQREIREQNLSKWRFFERAVWNWLEALNPAAFSKITSVTFGNWKTTLSSEEAVLVAKSELEADIVKVQNGIKTAEWLARKYNETEDDAEIARIAENILKRIS